MNVLLGLGLKRGFRSGGGGASIGSSRADRPVVPLCGAIRRMGGTLMEGGSNLGSSGIGSDLASEAGAGAGAGAGANLRISPRCLKKERPADGTREMEGD
jgi:hypothetical protein